METRLGGESPFKDLAEGMSPEHREAMAAALKNIFGNAFSRTAYAYDAQGRFRERTHSMGTLKEDRTTYRCDDLHDEPIEETTEDRSRQANLDDDGNVQYEPDKPAVQHNRFKYRYDAHGNWTERIVSHQPEGSSDFQRSNIERKTITYHAG
jgi:hypothetical protein